jgi:hypothetical protein
MNKTIDFITQLYGKKMEYNNHLNIYKEDYSAQNSLPFVPFNQKVGRGGAGAIGGGGVREIETRQI